MDPTDSKTGKLVGRILSVAIVVSALALCLVVIHRTDQNPEPTIPISLPISSELHLRWRDPSSG